MHDARARRLIRARCARNDELVAKSASVDRVRTHFSGESDALTTAQLFEMYADLDAIDSVEGARARVVRALDRLDAGAALVVEKRRLAVLREKVQGNANWHKAEVFAHVKQRADANEPHGLEVHELGAAHAEFHADGRLLFRWPMVEVPSQGRASRVVEWLVRTLVPPGVADVAGAASRMGASSVAQYKGPERPGVGYVLCALLPILDHASAMCKAGKAEYAQLKATTLAAVRTALAVPRARVAAGKHLS
jgi:hypothetical protein